MPRILVTGAAGFIGQIVSKALLDDESVELTLVDVIEPSIPRGAKYPQNGTTIKTDLIESSSSVIPNNLDTAILLHGVMSSAAEADLELGYRVNVDATRALLLNLAKKCPGVRVIYASSEAVYGTPVPKEGVSEATHTTPEMSYGCQKLICETLINDFTRRGMINGFSLRFPTISIRPGKPSPAVSAFLSGIIREPLNGLECRVPLKDRAWRHWMCSPKTLVYNVIVATKLPRDALAPHRRAVNVPGFAVTVQDMLDALEQVGGKDKLALVKEEPIPEMQSLLYSWADDFDNSLGLSLGMKQDTSFVQSCQDYLETLREEASMSSPK
ncbi:nucleoside-diphosphate-sugar epimerase [Fonsecaea erecta]|uniref:Nucleoside-diphosphate-sugar epimerase n=1 Tax=Fonsecaea erecta TaxID=1367422 RepID=A0A178ZC71_9EURO|nr:nucleoside-diphosphate-sugar epimerase [Fonsecaea erecta]OAP57358.1 nucleoside-diphosphate-sugar epimerase [Fonsecaea erecta]